MNSTILVVDDEPSARETILAILEGQGYILEAATNGPEAIQMANKITPDLILLDVMMPGMDGFKVCHHMREDARLREVPILLLTALDDRDSRLRGLRAGADDFVAKPFDPQELRTRVGTITRLNRYRTLLEQREHIKEMAERVIEAQEEERLRISREIHDDIGQALTAHQIQLQFIRDNIPDDRSDLKKSLQDLVVETSQTFAKLRLLAQDLRPPLLDTFGVAPALKAYCSDFSRRTGLFTNFDSDETIPEVSDTISVTLYRVLQESLSNITRHADASQAWVSLNADEDEICLTVQDNGQGFHPENVTHKGLGLQGMKERVTLSGGTFNLRSTSGEGTILTIRFPNKRSSLATKAEAE